MVSRILLLLVNGLWLLSLSSLATASYSLTKADCLAIDQSLPCDLTWVKPSSSSGRALGEAMGRTVNASLDWVYNDEMGLTDIFANYVANATYRAKVDSYLQLHRTKFPVATQEAEGFAAATGRPQHHFEIANFQTELTLMLDAAESGRKRRSMRKAGGGAREHCSAIGVVNPTANVLAMGHNEDWDAEMAAHMVMVETPEWTGYVYPGYFVGTSVTFNKKGLLFTMNSLTPLTPGVALPAFGYCYVLREVVGLSSVDEVLAKLATMPTYSGYSLNILSACDGEVANVEAYGDKLAVQRKSKEFPGKTVHFNEYLSLTVQQDTSGDSSNRLSCSKGAKFDNVNDIRAFLGNYSCPVFRTVDNTNGYASTMASFVADAAGHTIKVYRLPVGCSGLMGAGEGKCGTSGAKEVYETLTWDYKCGTKDNTDTGSISATISPLIWLISLLGSLVAWFISS